MGISATWRLPLFGLVGRRAYLPRGLSCLPGYGAILPKEGKHAILVYLAGSPVQGGHGVFPRSPGRLWQNPVEPSLPSPWMVFFPSSTL